MKYVRQLLIILFISFLGEVCKYLLPFPIPASIYGLLLLFTALMTGILKLSSIKETQQVMNWYCWKNMVKKLNYWKL